MSADVAAAVRSALLGYAPVASELPSYESSKAIFTRRPAPDDVAYPLIMVSPDIAQSNEDGVSDFRPVIIRDVAVYGLNEPATNYRQVERVAYAVKDLFHRNRAAITISGWSVTDIVASGPRPAPSDDQQTIGRLVELTIRLARKN